MTEKIINSLNIKMSPRDLKYTDPKGPLQSLFTNWLPLGKNLLDMVVEVLPSPLDMTSDKVEHLMCSKMKIFKYLPKETQELKNGKPYLTDLKVKSSFLELFFFILDFLNCKPDDSKPVIVFISKMFAAEKDSIAKKLEMLILCYKF